MAHLIVLLLGLLLAGPRLVPLWLSVRPDNLFSVPEVTAQNGQISGRVLGDDGVALDGATVRLRRMDSGQETPGKADRTGYFIFAGVPPGWYSVTASQPGYASLAYGAARPRAAGTPLVLVENTGLAPLTIRLPRAAVLSGTVRRPDGTPLGAINVVVLEKTITAAGVRGLATVDSVMTDDRGMYRIANIPPGQYVVKAAPPRAPISSADTPSAKATANFSGYANTFHPSAADDKAALPLVLSSGEHQDRTDILLRIVPLVRVGGRVLDSGGAPVAGGSVTLIQVESGGSAPTIATASISAGAFVLPNVAPGHYLLRANRPASASGPELSASLAISVSGSDLLDSRLLLQPAATVSGRAVFVGDSSPPSATSFRLGLYESSDAARPATSAVAAVLRPDGSLRFPGVEAGRYSIRTPTTATTAITSSWSLASVLVDQQEVIDSSFEIGVGQSIENVTLTFTNRLGQLSGSVLDRAGAPVTEFTVVVFPEDRRLWTAFRRRAFATRPANTGQFQVNYMPPGTYRVAAVRDAEPNEWLLPEFLETLAQSSVGVAVTDRTPATLQLVVNR